MIKLTTVRTVLEADMISALLKSKGIYTFIANAPSHDEVVVDLFVRPPSIEVWVIVDDQYPDAVELLKNPEHEVSKPSTQREMELMEKLEDNEYSPATVSIIKFATMIFFGTIALCVIAYWLRSR